MQAEILCIWYGQRRDVVKQKLVRPSRFERLTPALGGRCSIQLSYGREFTLAVGRGFSPAGHAGPEGQASIMGATSILQHRADALAGQLRAAA